MSDFEKDLKYSHECEDNPCWREVYRRAFPTMVKMVNHREIGPHQFAGIDRSIILNNSKQVLVDEKARRIHDTGDILLEYVSNDTTGTLGWIEKKLLCDYIAYAFIPSKRAYLLPVVQAQAAWKKSRDKWLERYGTLSASNNGYNTLNCPVPINVLYPAIGNMLRIAW